MVNMKSSAIIRFLAAGALALQATATPLDIAMDDVGFQKRQEAPPTPTSAPAEPNPTRPAGDTRSPPPDTVTVARAAMTPYLYGCDKGQKAKVNQAWNEAGKLADAHAQWKPPGWFNSGSYQPAMDMYLGTDSRKDDPWVGTGPLKKNINRQQGIHSTNETWSPYWSYVYIYCDESKVPTTPNKPKDDECSRPNQPGKKVVAYTFPDDGTIFGWNAKYVVLCPRFFDDDILTLEQQTTNARTDDTLKKVIDPWRKVKARSLFHETYHWGPAEVSDPICNRRPEIYEPSRVVSLANAENTEGARTNAESWAQAAMAMYVQQTFNLNDPPRPKEQVSEADLGDFVDDIEEKFFDVAPEWFQSPVDRNAETYSPPMDGVEMLDVDGGAPPTTDPNPPDEPPETGTPCEGNQIQGDCTQAHLPDGTPNSGPFPPVCEKVGTERKARINRDKANEAVSGYCQNLVDNGVVLSATTSNPAAGSLQEGVEGDGQLSVVVMFDVDSCDADTAEEDQKLDFGAFGLEQCHDIMYNNIEMVCSQDSTWTDYNADFSMLGGTLGYKCGLFSVFGTNL